MQKHDAIRVNSGRSPNACVRHMRSFPSFATTFSATRPEYDRQSQRTWRARSSNRYARS